jgi:CP family cyanate transporter-like MFS transporter
VAAILRVTPPLPYSIYFWTAILSIAIAVAQPGIVVTVRSWFPAHIQQVSTVYAISFGVGGLAAATLTVFLLTLGGWQATFVTWGLIALVAGCVWLALAPGRGAPHLPMPHGLGRLVREPQVWHVTSLFGCQSLVFYGVTTWIPFLLRGYTHSYLAVVLFLFQVVSLPLIGALFIIRVSWARSRLWYTSSGLLMTVGSFMLMLGLTDLAWLWALLMGLGAGMMFAGVTALPVILARSSAEVAGYSALSMTAGYLFAFIGPLLGVAHPLFP